MNAKTNLSIFKLASVNGLGSLIIATADRHLIKIRTEIERQLFSALQFIRKKRKPLGRRDIGSLCNDERGRKN
jgi:hypothetical protein